MLGIPKGGVEVAYQVSQILAFEFSIIIVRKLPFPDDPEAGFGAIAEDGTVWLMPQVRHMLAQEHINRILDEQQAEVLRRIKVLRGGQSLPDLDGRHVILVDDGIAMGSTIQVAALCCRNKGAKRVTVAAPVASPDAHAAIKAMADEVVVLETPPFFQAVAEYYKHWYDVPDQEVVAIMAKARLKALKR